MSNLMKYRAFTEAVKCGSLSAAAAELSYTQPAVSRMISSLEEEYGFLLLNRNKDGVTLTDAGERVFSLCEQILDAEDRLELGQPDKRFTGRYHQGVCISQCAYRMVSPNYGGGSREISPA